MTQANLPAYLKGVVPDTSAQSLASTSSSYPRISLKGRQFRFVEGGEEVAKTGNPIEVSILGVEPDGAAFIKTFYRNGYNPSDTAPPDCSSANGRHPDAWVQSPQSPNCASCPKNAFGSAIGLGGKKTKACRDSKRIWVARANDVKGTVYALGIPVTSLKAVSDYARNVIKLGVPLWAVKTRIQMADSEFPVLEFENAGFLDEDQGEVAMRRNTDRDFDIGKSDGPPAIADDSRARALPSTPTDAGADLIGANSFDRGATVPSGAPAPAPFDDEDPLAGWNTN